MRFCFIVEEHVDGASLRHMLDRKLEGGRPFSLKGAYNVIAHVCNALAHAHASLTHGALTLGDILSEAGVPASAVFDTMDVFTDPHLNARNFIQKVPHPEQGEITLMEGSQ